MDAGKRGYASCFYRRTNYPVHCRVLVFVGSDILGRRDDSVYVPAAGLTSLLRSAVAWWWRRGGP